MVCTLVARMCLIRWPNALLALLLATTALAQEGAIPRAKAFGLIKDSAGKSIADATVTLWSWPLSNRTDVGQPDVVTVQTRPNGRFAAPILEGRAYSAFAQWRHPDGATHRTAVEDDVVPGSPRVLRMVTSRPECTLEVRGIRVWHREGPLKVTVSVGVRNSLVLPVQLDRDGKGTLPAGLPPGVTWIDVRTASGRLLRASKLPATPERMHHVVQMPAAQPCTVQVLGRAGQRLANALVHQMHDYGYRGAISGRRTLAPDLVGTTNASGEFAFRVPADHPIEGGQPRVLLLITAKDHQRHTVDLLLQSGAHNKRVVAKLNHGVNLRGRFVDAHGKPVTKGLIPMYESYADTDSSHPTTGLCPLPPMPLDLAADGSFEGLGLHNITGVRLFAVVDPAHAKDLGIDVSADAPLPPLFPIANYRRVPAEDLELGDIQLDKLAVVRFVVRDEAGTPVQGARMRFDRRGFFAPVDDYVADRVGRLQMPLPDGEYHIGAFLPGGGVANMVLDVPIERRPDEPVVLELSQPLVVRGRVTPSLEQGEPETEVVLTGVNGVERHLLELAYGAITPTKVSADGSFALTVPFGMAQFTLCTRVRKHPREARYGEHVQVPIGAEGVTDVVLAAPPSDK